MPAISDLDCERQILQHPYEVGAAGGSKWEGHWSLEGFEPDIIRVVGAYKATSSYSMAEVNVQIPTTEVEGNVKQGGIGDDADRPRVRSESAVASSSSSSSQPGPSRRVSTRRPDGSSGETGPSDLESLEKVLRGESIVDVIEMAHLTLPSTPVRDSVDGVSNDVRINLELASVKLSKLAPTN